MPKRVDLIGSRFTRLLIISKDTKNRHGKRYWKCLCDCGKEVVVPTSDLRNGHTRSCGCLHDEVCSTKKITHGYSDINNATYRCWQNMKARCLNKNTKSYYRYGGRGIKIYELWINDFKLFLRDVGQRPSNKHSLDRFPNNDGNYEPSNVRWATSQEQSSNRSDNLLLDNGETKMKMTLSQWARHLKVTHSSIQYHLSIGKSISEIASYYQKPN